METLLDPPMPHDPRAGLQPDAQPIIPSDPETGANASVFPQTTAPAIKLTLSPEVDCERLPTEAVTDKLLEEETTPGDIDADTLGTLISLGVVILTATGFILAARGGNYKVVRKNLQQAGKANGKSPMSREQRVLRRRKRKK
jgi:hypothetical protein